jgi:hypothetical protein
LSNDRKDMKKKLFDYSNETKSRIKLSEEVNLFFFYAVASCAPLPCKYHSYLQSRFNAAMYNTIIIVVMIITTIIIIGIILYAYIQTSFCCLFIFLTLQGQCNTFNFVAFLLFLFTMRSLVNFLFSGTWMNGLTDLFIMPDSRYLFLSTCFCQNYFFLWWGI